LKLEQAGCPETLASNYRPMLPNISEERKKNIYVHQLMQLIISLRKH